MAKLRLRPDADDVEVDRLVDEIFSRANPNPSRVGCLSPATLFELAHRQRNIDDPGYKHLTVCSPCYCQFIVMMRANDKTSH